MNQTVDTSALADPLADLIRARRDELTAQSERARLEYADLEEEIRAKRQSLALLLRNIDAMHGGIHELDTLLHTTTQEDSAHASPPPPPDAAPGPAA